MAGDSTELKSIVNSFCTDRETPLCIGSIKSNIGHLESASGLAGLIKAILVLEKGVIPPNVNLERLKKGLSFEKGKLRVSVQDLSKRRLVSNMALRLSRYLEHWSLGRPLNQDCATLL